MWKNKEKLLSTLVLLLIVAIVFFVCSRDAEKTGHDMNEGSTEKKATEGLPR